MTDYRQAERELHFYFNQADAAIGFKSSHASFVASVYGVSTTFANATEADPYTDGLLKQVRKIRKIRHTFYQLPKRTQRILDACHNLEVQFRYPPELVHLYGSKTGAIFFTSQCHDLSELIALCRKKIQRKLSPQEEIKMFHLGEEGRKIWDEAHQQYLSAKQKGHP